MPIELKMPALSPTMEEGTLARWLVKEGDAVKSGDILAEIETDKATMEYEAIDEGTIAQIVIPEGSDAVKVGAVIAVLAEEGEDASAARAAPPVEAKVSTPEPSPKAAPTNGRADPDDTGSESAPLERSTAGAEDHGRAPVGATSASEGAGDGDRIKASPLARRLAEQQGIDLGALAGSGPNGRIVKADLDGARPGEANAKPQPAANPEPAATASAPAARPAPAPAPAPAATDIPHEAVKLSGMRKTIARRLTESKQTVPHIYLTVDVNLDRLLKLRAELNDGLAARGIKLSVNDLLIKALAGALGQVPACNVQFAGEQLLMFRRADISVAVSIPGGLITPIVVDAGGKSVSAIATAMKDLAGRAKEGKLQPAEYQGGTASLSNMGMYGIKQFDAVINPPQGMILAIGAGEQRPAVIGGSLQIATVMSATGSFDHRAIDGADGAQLMKAFRDLVEAPLAMLA